MKLSDDNLAALDGRVARPAYDRSDVKAGIVHIGVGGFHRAHQAVYVDDLLNDGVAGDWGICGVGLLPPDRKMRDALSAQDHLYTVLTRASDGTMTARVIGSLVGYLYAPDAPDDVLAVMTRPETRIVSLTVTEGGYDIDTREARADAASDRPSTVFDYVVEALSRRRASGVPPFTVMSCDNLPSNGDVARAAFSGFAERRDPGLGTWIRHNVHFPNSMVDRITPVTTGDDIALLRDEFGVEDAWPVVCEPFRQWVLEDSFGLGRPPFDRAGVQLTGDVEPYELMKLRLLNGTHQALAYPGILCGYAWAHEATADPAIAGFLRGYMDEARLTLTAPAGADLVEYSRSVLDRFASPYVRDTVARLAAFSSDRLPKFVLPVIRASLAAGRPCPHAIAIIACWARYLEGTDEGGRPLEIEDGLRDQLVKGAARQHQDPLALLAVTQIFGGLGQQPEFRETYRRTLEALKAHGVRPTVQRLPLVT
jgi:mannitol 2-dehydrogenase